MKRAFVIGPIAEKAYRDIVAPQPLGRQRRPHRDGQTAADNAVGPKVAGLDIGNMHRPAAPVAIAGLFAKELGEHPAHIGPFGDAVPVTTMGRGDFVVVCQLHAGGHGAGLLADGQVHGAVDQAARVTVLGPFLEPADQIHLVQRRAQSLGRIGADRKRAVIGCEAVHASPNITSWRRRNSAILLPLGKAVLA